MPKARGAARKALELDDTLGNAHNSLAVIKMYYDRDYGLRLIWLRLSTVISGSVRRRVSRLLRREAFIPGVR